jgi:hypothetical protein
VLSGNTSNLQALSIGQQRATELTFAQAQVQSEIVNVLTAEQKQKIAERRSRWKPAARCRSRDSSGSRNLLGGGWWLAEDLKNHNHNH